MADRNLAVTRRAVASPKSLTEFLRPLARIGLATWAVVMTAVAATPELGPRGLPPIVFVSRRPMGRNPQAGVPGLGSRQRAVVTGGHLLVRRPDGRVAPFVPPARFFDVSDPSVSFDGRRVAFAAVTHPDSAWRIWIVDADGGNLRVVTRTDRALDLSAFGAAAKPFRRYDDLDPCWLPDGRICFSTTRYPLVAQAGGLATNLFVIDAAGARAHRITSERDGADEPSVDPATGRIVYARWWGNRFHATNTGASGITTDTALALPPRRSVVWHALTIRPDGEGVRLAGGYPRVRDQTMAYQPVLLPDGTLVGVTADTLSLEPHPGRVRIAVYPGGFAEPVTFPAAPAQMCSPSPLPDGRLLVAWDREGRGDFRIAAVNRDGTGIESLADVPGRLDLDPVALAPRPLPPPAHSAELGGLPRLQPARDRADLDRELDTVRFDCLNVFSNAPVDFPIPDAPPIARDLRIRFFAAFSRPGAPAGDTVAFLRDAMVERSGAIHEDVTPGDLPMFEQLIDAHGHVVETASGPAHVPGFNAGRSGSGTQCVGCHTGHTAIAVPLSYALGKRFNAAPSAEVTASSEAPGSRARALVDRRTRGPWGEVAWVAEGNQAETATLKWAFALEVDSLVIYGVRPEPALGTDLRLAGCDVTLRRDGRVVKTLRIASAIDPSGTKVSCDGIRADRVEIRPFGASGRVGGAARMGLAEVEAMARIPED
jgi:hypothetical protein